MNFLNRFSRRQIVGVLLVCAVIVISGVLLSSKATIQRFLPKASYEETYSLVPNSLSEHAAIPITLPKGVSVSESAAQAAIQFTPDLPGTWTPSGTAGVLVYQPKEVLKKGSQYTVSLTLPEGTLEKAFLVEEDPAVIAVFPKAEGEAPETSSISIVFNRPMVPLTTLDEVSKQPVPITLTPATTGSFKWISTRILQFVPEKRLLRSQHYTVSIQKGFTSLDGLPVPEKQYVFSTRALRFEGSNFHHEGTTVHSEPIIVRFNQPVDLEKMRSNITVVNTTTSAEVRTVLEYGLRGVYDEKSGKYTDYVDRSVLAIYNAKDASGREKLWDAETSYTATVAGAVPLEGDTKLEETRSVYVNVPSYIASVSAVSSRSANASATLFDPEGQVVVRFYDDIDKDASSISAPGLSKIEYAEKCKSSDDGYYYNASNCEKVPDKSKILLSFKSAQFEKGQNIDIQFKRIVDAHGVAINPNVLTRSVRTYPQLSILKVIAGGKTNDAGTNGSVRLMTICSNSPLKEPGDKEFYSKVTANFPLGKWNWGDSRLITLNDSRYADCTPGEYQTVIYYGLLPETAYDIVLNLDDDFGQTISQQISFRTESLPDTYRHLYSLQKGYSVTSPEKTKLTYAVENLEYVDVHVCRVSPLTMLTYLDYDGRPREATPGESLPCTATFTKRIDLPKTYWTKNYFQFSLADIVPTGPLGQYVVTLSHPNLRTERYDYNLRKTIPGERIYPHTLLSVTRLAVQSKNISASSYGADVQGTSFLAKTSGNLYWVSQIGKLAPVAGAKVDVYQSSSNKGLTRAPGGVTGADGVARTTITDNVFGAIVTSGNDSAIVTSATDRFEYGYGEAPAIRTYLYTDRPIYRPGQEVFFKGLMRLGYDGDYEVWKDKPADIHVYGPTGEELSSQKAEMSEYGTFASSLKLDAGAALGTYRITSQGGSAYFDVEEYKPAAFKVEMQSSKDEYIAGDTLNVTVSADYYFGVPIEKGSVEYSIVSQDYYFDRYTDKYFNFGEDWYYSPYGSYGDTFLTRGQLSLDENGKGTISQKLDFKTLFKEEAADTSKIFVIRATAKNSTGQAISSEKSVIVHRGAHYLGGIVEPPYFAKGQVATIRVKSVDTKGKEIPLSGITGEIYRISWEYSKRQEVDGGFYYSSTQKKDLVDSFFISTDGRGNGSYSHTPAKEGEYSVVLKSKDSAGNIVTSATSFYVYGAGAVDVRPTNNESLDLIITKKNLSVNDVGSFVIVSPFKKAKALVTLERGQIFDYKIIDIDQNLFNYSFAVTEDHIPNVYASVLLLSPTPEIRYGQASFEINSKEKELSIGVKTDKNNYLPGEAVTVTIETKNSKGQPVPAEVSLAVADLSVLALKGNPKKNPVAFFYDGLPLAVNTSSNIKNVLTEAEIPTGTKGGGGLEASELAKKKRGTFKDTALWRSVVRTGTSGVTSVTFTLPDNLTTWQAEAVGITTDTKVGSGYSELVAKKPVTLTPLIPRFVIPGDKFMVGAKVINDTDDSQRMTVSVASKSLKLPSGTSDSVSLAARGSETVYFEATAPLSFEEGNHELTLSAKNSVYEDTVEQVIPVGTTAFYETTATAGFTQKSAANEYVYVPDSVVANKGGLTVTTESSLVPYLAGALNYLIAYPYGCSEQISSQIAALAILKRNAALNKDSGLDLSKIQFNGQTYSADDLVAIGLQKMYSAQTSDGGFGYYAGFRSSYSLTLSVLDAMQDLRSAGYAVDQKVIDRASKYVYEYMTSPPSGYALDTTSIVMGINTLTHLGGVWNQSPYRNYFDSRISTIAGNRSYLYDEAPNPVLATIALITTRGVATGYSSAVFAALENRVSIDTRGSFITSGTDNRLYGYYETPEKNTALYLKALVASKKESPVQDGILRWLIARKQRDGSWTTTNTTLAVIDALSDYIQYKREGDAAYNFTLDFGGKRLEEGQLPDKSGVKKVSTFVPIDQIEKNRLLTLGFTKKDVQTVPGTLYYTAALSYALPTEKLPPRDEGFAISRAFYAKDDVDNTTPLVSAKVGDVIRGHITITVAKDRTLVAVEDYIPAGMEIVNLNLATEDQSLGSSDKTRYDGDRGSVTGSLSKLAAGIFGLGSHPELDDKEYGPRTVEERLYPDTQESHDDRLFLFKESMYPGVYTFDYYARALIPGTYSHLPAVVSQLYAPEVFGRTPGATFTVVK